MLSRRDILSVAADDCTKELYTLVQPAVTWEDFTDQCKEYTKKYKAWEQYNHAKYEKNTNPEEWEKYSDLFPSWNNKSITECIGPRPYEFYYLPKEVMKRITENYIYVYRMDKKQDLLDTIDILKKYCEEPIIDKYIDDHTDENGNYHPGYRGYEHPDNIITEISQKCNLTFDTATQCWDKVKEFLDMAGNFFDWNSELSSFNMTVYLGPSPNSNKEAVIENWKKYRDTDIEIDESKWQDEDEDF